MSSANECTVSVCVPAFTAERFVGDTVRSVLAQTFGDFELLVADNHSPDNTASVARTAAGCDPRVRVMVNDVNLGLIGNFNALVAAARGRYVKILCADDTLLPSCLEQQVRALDSNPAAVMACSRRHIVDAARPRPVGRLWSPRASTRLRRRSHRGSGHGARGHNPVRGAVDSPVPSGCADRCRTLQRPLRLAPRLRALRPSVATRGGGSGRRDPGYVPGAPWLILQSQPPPTGE